jgi:hypothetical protein
MACKLCATRRPRRYCPGVGGDICTICCGAERENSVACPLDCEFLREARLRERPPTLEPSQVPHPDIRVTDEFLYRNERLVGFLIQALAEAGFASPGIIDYDAREALDGLVRTYRTLESGLYYESKPANMVAAGIFSHLQQRVEEFRKASQEQTGVTAIRDADVLGVLVFLQRIEAQSNNGRKRGRAFLDFLRQHLEQRTPAPSSMLVP